MLSRVATPEAPENRWQSVARIGTALGFALLGGLAFAAIADSVPRALSSPLAAAELPVNLCAFVLFMLVSR